MPSRLVVDDTDVGRTPSGYAAEEVSLSPKVNRRHWGATFEAVAGQIGEWGFLAAVAIVPFLLCRDHRRRDRNEYSSADVPGMRPFRPPEGEPFGSEGESAARSGQRCRYASRS